MKGKREGNGRSEREMLRGIVITLTSEITHYELSILPLSEHLNLSSLKYCEKALAPFQGFGGLFNTYNFSFEHKGEGFDSLPA